jgi:hypothetical protein
MENATHQGMINAPAQKNSHQTEYFADTHLTRRERVLRGHPPNEKYFGTYFADVLRGHPPIDKQHRSDTIENTWRTPRIKE